MTTSAYMPDVVVEIAFDSNWLTPAMSRTWTDVSDYVELRNEIKITFGRGDEFAAPDANTLTLVLDNSDGRFTPEKATGAYYPNVKIGKPIRVTATLGGGSSGYPSEYPAEYLSDAAANSTRFLGYINDWAPSSAGTNPVVTVTASSQLARLGLGDPFPAALLATYGSLLALWKLDEAALPLVDASHSLPSFGSKQDPVGFQSGVGPTGSSTALRITGDSVSRVDTTSPLRHTLPTEVVLEAFMRSTSSTAAFVGVGAVDTDMQVSLERSGSDLIVSDGMTNSYAFAADTELHHVATYYDGADAYLYLDGAVVASTAYGSVSQRMSGMQIYGVGSGGTIDVSYVALTTDVDGIPSRALGGLQNIATGTASERIETYADYVGLEAVDVDATTETLTAYPVYDKTTLEAMRAAEKSDGGTLYDAPDGTLTYRDRESRYNTTSSFTLSAASHQIEANVTPKLDRSALINQATVTQTNDSTVLARARDASSIEDYGRAASDWEIQGTLDQCLQAAKWAVFLHGEPETRIPTLDIDLLPLSTSLQADVFGATIGTHFTISDLPTEFAASSVDLFVEGYTESIGLESYVISLNVSKRDPAKWNVWTIEDATYGAYDANPIAW